MINHIGKYNDAQAIQAALDAGTLANPYVAMTSAGTIDYNSLAPEEPSCYIGEWSKDGETYTFQILDTGDTAWNNPVNIGTLEGVYSDGNYGDLDVMLNFDHGSGSWHMVFYTEEASNTPEYDFEEEWPHDWESGAMTDPGDSDAVIRVNWDGTDTFVFQADGGWTPLTITTINPECSE